MTAYVSNKNGRAWTATCGLHSYTWTLQDCAIKLQVHRNGMVTIVDPLADAGEGQETYDDKFKKDSSSLFAQ